jgi:hypothetical protein
MGKLTVIEGTRHGATQPEATRERKGVFIRMRPEWASVLKSLCDHLGQNKAEVIEEALEEMLAKYPAAVK